MSKEDRKFVSHDDEFDFVVDITPDKVKKTLDEWFEENQRKHDVFNPNWEHFERVVKSDKYSPKTVIITKKDESPSLESAAEFIGSYIEIVHTRTGAQLIIDEEGGLKDVPINSIASQLYGSPIFGPAMILRGEAKWT